MAITRTGAAAEHWENARKLFSGVGGVEEDKAKALVEYSEVIKLLPNDAESYERRAYCYSDQEQFEKAIADMDKAISIEPKNGDFYCTRGYFNLKNGEMEKAKPDYEKGLALLPKKEASDKCFTIGMTIKQVTGNKREAAVFYQKCVELGGEYADAAKRKLAELGV